MHVESELRMENVAWRWQTDRNTWERNFYNGFLSYNGFITDFFENLAFLGQFDLEFKGVIENL